MELKSPQMRNGAPAYRLLLLVMVLDLLNAHAPQSEVTDGHGLLNSFAGPWACPVCTFVNDTYKCATKLGLPFG